VVVEPYTIAVQDAVLTDLRRRIAATRWPDQVAGAGWDYGTEREYLRELLTYWERYFDWRVHEAALNELAHFRTEVDGVGIHFLHHPAARAGAIPLLLLHGWPSSFLQMTRILPLLVDAGFDVVVPSLPGYGFSDRPDERGVSVGRVAALLSGLMTRGLGYPSYAVRASDVGAGVAAALPRRELIGVHLCGTNPFLGPLPDDLSAEEEAFVAELRRWVQDEFAYGRMHATKPQTLAYGLNDSPAGLAAWVVEKFRSWSDCGGDVESRFSKDDLLANLTIYWATETIGSSVRIYYESVRDRPRPDDASVRVPTAVATFPKDIVPPPRAWVERSGPVERWTEMPRGGHFGEWEEPELLAADITAFLDDVRPRG
jgi:pimeloyl-ACP methyl ester carboxylesterase